MAEFFKKAISDFENRKLSNKKHTRPYGKWTDKWNVAKILNTSVKYYLINKIKNNEY